ncbi:MAG: class I SAM-dependent methyltransferase [Pseudomonadota bacterium]
MTGIKRLDVDAAYQVETPNDNVQLYKQWASTYDDDFVDRTNYVQFQHVADALARHQKETGAAVLDVGCGTGIVGVALNKNGFERVDGIDISPEMLRVAADKRTASGSSVYRALLEADLTKRIDLADDTYAGIVSAGTFTHGHLGPESLDELFRVAAPRAWLVITVRSTHYESAGFAAKLGADVAAGLISEPKLIEINVYAPDSPDAAHADDKAMLVICQVT